MKKKKPLFRKEYKEKEIEWTPEKLKKLEEVLTKYNERISSLKKRLKDTTYLPKEVLIFSSKKMIKTDEELNRIIERYGSFKGSKASKKVQLKSGKYITAWEKEQLEIERKTALKRINKKMKEIKQPEYRMRF